MSYIRIFLDDEAPGGRCEAPPFVLGDRKSGAVPTGAVGAWGSAGVRIGAIDCVAGMQGHAMICGSVRPSTYGWDPCTLRQRKCKHSAPSPSLGVAVSTPPLQRDDSLRDRQSQFQRSVLEEIRTGLAFRDSRGEDPVANPRRGTDRYRHPHDEAIASQ